MRMVWPMDWMTLKFSPIDQIMSMESLVKYALHCKGAGVRVHLCHPRVAEVMECVPGHEIDAGFDVEHSGVNRVGKNEIVDYIYKNTK